MYDNAISNCPVKMPSDVCRHDEQFERISNFNKNNKETGRLNWFQVTIFQVALNTEALSVYKVQRCNISVWNSFLMVKNIFFYLLVAGHQ